MSNTKKATGGAVKAVEIARPVERQADAGEPQLLIFLEEAAALTDREPWATKIKELLLSARATSSPREIDPAWTMACVQAYAWLSEHGHDHDGYAREAMDEHYQGGFNQFLTDRGYPLGL